MSQRKHKAVVIVHPLESGTLLVAAFKQIGVDCILISNKNDVQHLNTLDYIEILLDSGNQTSLRNKLDRYHIIAITPGSEQAVILSDQLASYFNVYANTLELSTARRDKSLMAIATQQAKLPVPSQVTIRTHQQLTSLLKTGLFNNDFDWPVILKPTQSMGSEDVHLCKTEEALKNACQKVLGSNNRLQLKNQECLIQEYLQGTEYAVDTVSVNGKHTVVSFWQYQKPNDDSIIGLLPFSSKRLLSSNGHVQSLLTEYINTLLTALGIKHGPAHTELIITHDNDVKLIESAARLHGGIAAMLMAESCIGWSQAQACAMAYVNPATFLKQFSTPYKLSHYGEIVLLIAPHTELRLNTSKTKEIQSLKSVSSININTHNGMIQSRIVGLITLHHSDLKVIESDLATIRQIEKDEFYQTNYALNSLSIRDEVDQSCL